MLSVTINISGRAVAGAALIGIAVAISSLGIVRAEREGIRPDTKVFSCTSGKACIEGNATGKNIEGVFGNSAAGTGVQGNSTATNSTRASRGSTPRRPAPATACTGARPTVPACTERLRIPGST